MKKEMFESLLKVQGELKPVKKDEENPFFKSEYATLGAIWKAIQPVLSKNGFIVNQPVRGTNVVTILSHISGDELTSEFPIVTKSNNNPQDFGSAVTYARRYALSSLLGIVTEDDDDGNAATPIKEEVKNGVSTEWQKVYDKTFKILDDMTGSMTDNDRESAYAATCKKVLGIDKPKKLKYLSIADLNKMYDHLSLGLVK
jgi:hypothetical protein